MKNVEYKNKYLKYKNKYYNFIKNKKFKGGYIQTVTLIGLILSIISGGIYLTYNKNEDNYETQEKIEVYNAISIKINNDINEYFDILNKTITNKNNSNLYKRLYNFYKYDYINMKNFFKIDNNKNIQVENLITLFSKLKNETPILTLQETDKVELLKDSFIYCLKESIQNNNLFDQSIKIKINNTSSLEIRTDLIEFIEQQKTYDVYFVEDLNTNTDKSNTDKNDISIEELKEHANLRNTQDNKLRFIEFMKLNNNSVSDFPMIHAASDKYGIYIVLLVNFTNTRYFKIYTPNNINEPATIKNTIVLNYSNYCNHNCDFMNNENINNVIKNINTINTSSVITDSNLLKMNNNNNNITNLYNINNDILDMNFDWADKDDNKYLKKNEMHFFKNTYNNIDANINKISQQYNLSYNEKKNINNELKVRPWFEYYQFNDNLKPY